MDIGNIRENLLPAPDAALDLLRSGAEGVKRWSTIWKAYVESKKPIGEKKLFSLAKADLAALDLSDVDLSFVDLRQADLRRCLLGRSDFFGADLSGARLDQAIALSADFRTVNASQSSSTEAVFTKCDLRNSAFREANLEKAVLIMSDLSEVDFDKANLRHAAIHHSYLTGANFRGAALHEVSLWNDHFVDVDLTPFINARTEHSGPSSVDWRCILKSSPDIRLSEFLIATGMPKMFATALVGIARSVAEEQKPALLRSVFISYGAPDESFARRLYEALSSHGIVTFFFPESSVPGARLSSLMSAGVNQHDQTILVCSEASLVRCGVRNEIQLALDREAREGASIRIIPVTLDDFVFTDWWPERPENSTAIRDRVIADFRDSARFSSEIGKLLIALLR